MMDFGETLTWAIIALVLFAGIAIGYAWAQATME